MKKENSGFFVSLIRLMSKLLDFFTGKAKRQEEERKRLEIENAKTELKNALAEGRVTDAAYWRRKLTQLSGTFTVTLTIAVMTALISCCTTPTQTAQPPPTVVIGERINKVSPEDMIKVPKLYPPAKQWYLIDDIGLFQWLDIDLAQPPNRKSP